MAVISEKISRLLESAVRKNFDAQVKLLGKLVRTSSENPLSPEEADPHRPVETAVAEVLYEQMQKMGFSVKKVGVSKKRPNIVCQYGPRRFRKSLLFNGHMDTTVAEQNGRGDPFSGVIRQNKLYGLGSCDMKASLTAYIYALKAVAQTKMELAGRVTLQFVVDTEPGACSEYGTAYLLNRGIRARAAVIGKPGTHTIAIGHRGGYRFKLQTKGAEVHTGLSLWEKAKMGKNAVVDMAEVIRLLEKLEIPFKSARLFPGRKPVFTFPTKISGGRSVNLVPDRCVGYGDVRLMPGNSANQVKLLMQERLVKAKEVKYSIEDLLFVPAVEIDPKEEVVMKLSGVAEQVLKRKPEIRGVGPWNDAWMFITRDIPCVCGFGPDGGDLGTNKEWVSLSSLKQVTEIYAKFIVEMLGLKESE